MSFNRLTPQSIRYGPGLALATNGALAVTGFFTAPVPMEVVAASLVQGGGSTLTSGTSGSGFQVNVYKNGSNSGSYIATVNNGAGTVIPAGGKALTLGAVANRKLAAGDQLMIHVGTPGGVSPEALVVGWYLQVDVIYGNEN